MFSTFYAMQWKGRSSSSPHFACPTCKGQSQSMYSSHDVMMWVMSQPWPSWEHTLMSTWKCSMYFSIFRSKLARSNGILSADSTSTPVPSLCHLSSRIVPLGPFHHTYVQAFIFLRQTFTLANFWLELLPPVWVWWRKCYLGFYLTHTVDMLFPGRFPTAPWT